MPPARAAAVTIALDIDATPKASPLVVMDAARNASTNSPITSSITAAPRITVPSFDDMLPGIHQRSRGNRTLVAVKSSADEKGNGPRQAEQVTDARAQKKRPYHAGKRYYKCRDARFLHSIDIRLDARYEHQYVSADLRKKQERIRSLAHRETDASAKD